MGVDIKPHSNQERIALLLQNCFNIGHSGHSRVDILATENSHGQSALLFRVNQLERKVIIETGTAKTGPLLTPNFEKSILFGYC